MIDATVSLLVTREVVGMEYWLCGSELPSDNSNGLSCRKKVPRVLGWFPPFLALGCRSTPASEILLTICSPSGCHLPARIALNMVRRYIARAKLGFILSLDRSSS